jgi:cytochrome c oxidase subunit I+III
MPKKCIGELVGNVYHDACDSDSVRLSGLRLLFLLDGSRGFPPCLRTGPRDLLALCGGGVAPGFLGADSSRAPVDRGDTAVTFYAGLVAACLLSLTGGAAILAGPWLTGLDPTEHVYAAIVWLLAIWVALHAATGLIMQIYCVARRIAGCMTARHDIDIWNVSLFWHFAAITVVITVAVIAGFPLVK